VIRGEKPISGDETGLSFREDGEDGVGDEEKEREGGGRDKRVDGYSFSTWSIIDAGRKVLR